MPFDGSVVEVVRDGEGNPWVNVRSVCLAVGIDDKTQRRKIEADPSFSWGHMTSTGSDGKQYVMFCIPLDQLNAWLFHINVNKVPDHIKPNLLAYKKECAKVLYNHFMPRGERDLNKLMEVLTDVRDTCKDMNTTLGYLSGLNLTVFGDDAPVVSELLNSVARELNMTVQEVWGMVRRECDVSSYKLQNRKIINFLKNLLGKGIKLVTDEESHD